MCLPHQYLVLALRTSKALCRLLPDRLSCFCLLWHPSLRSDANGTSSDSQTWRSTDSIQDGVAGYRGWRWIFIIEGILTCIIGIVGYFFLVDFPDRASKTAWNFLNEAECQFIMRRVAKDRDDATTEAFNFKKWAASGLDLKIWGFAMIYLCLTTIAYAIAYVSFTFQSSMV